MRGHLGAGVPANGRLNPAHHVIINAILEWPRRRLPVQFGPIGLVFAEQPLQPVLAPGTEVAIIEFMMTRQNPLAVQPQAGLGCIEGPAPVIARPELGQHLQACGLVRTVMHGDAHENIVGLMLGVFDTDVAVVVVCEHTGIKDFILGIRQPTTGVFGDQVSVGKGRMGIFVEHAHVGMARHAIDEKVQFLDVFTVVAFGVVEAEQTFLEDCVTLVPQRQAQAPALSLVTETGQSILAPSIGAAACMLMREVGPGVTVGAVVFAHRAPLAFTQVRAPVAPLLGAWRCQALAFEGVQQVGCGFGRHWVLLHLHSGAQCRAQ